VHGAGALMAAVGQNDETGHAVGAALAAGQ
jgi:hypothetical protein